MAEPSLLSGIHATEFLKTHYLPGLNVSMERAKGTFYEMLPKKPEKIGGDQTKFKIKIGEGSGQGQTTEGGDFPVPGDPKYAEGFVSVGRVSHTVSWSMDEMELLEGGDEAAVPVIREKMDDGLYVMQRDVQRQALGDGTGILGRVETTGTSISAGDGTLKVKSTTTNVYDRDRKLWIEPYRMRYAAVDQTTGALEYGPFRITARNADVDSLTVEYDSESGISGVQTAPGDGAYIVRYGDWASGGAFRSLEFPGIRSALADDNTYTGIDRTSNANDFWRPTVNDNGGTVRTMTTGLIHSFMVDFASRTEDGMQPTKEKGYCAFGDFAQWAEYHELMTPGLRYTLSESAPDIGWGGGLEFLGIPLYRDIKYPSRRIDVFRKDDFQFLQAKYGESNGLLRFRTNGGSMFFQANATTGNGHSARVYSYITGMISMYTDKPRNQGSLQDLDQTVVS